MNQSTHDQPTNLRLAFVQARWHADPLDAGIPAAVSAVTDTWPLGDVYVPELVD